MLIVNKKSYVLILCDYKQLNLKVGRSLKNPFLYRKVIERDYILG